MPLPTEVIPSKSMQRELADSIIRMVPLDEIRILLACGAKVNEPVTQGLRPLHYAIWQRYLEATRLLLVRGCDVNARDDCGYSALHLSAEHGYTELVNLLLESGAAVDYRPDTGEEFPRTTLCDEPLRLAIRNKHYEVAKSLLEHGADPNKRYFFGAEINLVSDPEYLELLLTFGANPDSRDRAGMTPLMKAARQRKGIESVLLLISHGADVNAIADARNDYRTVLHYAVLSGNTDVVNLLIKQGARLNYDCPDLSKPSPLDLAILKGDVPMVELLLNAGAQVNASSSVIGSPLHVACSDNISNRKEIIEILLDSGADPNLKVYSEEDSTQLRPALAEYLASNSEPSGDIVRLLLRFGARVIMKTQFRDPDGILNHLQNVTAEENEHIFYLLLEAAEAFDLCMIKRNHTLNATQKETLIERAKTPISLLAQGIESVLLLISHGADVNAIADARNDYRTVLHYAVLSGNTDVVNLLIKQGARLNYDCPDLSKPSPLDLAILKGDVPMVELLLNAGAQVNASSSVIGSPLHVACSDNISNRKEIIEILLDSGADPNLKVYSEEDSTQLRPALAEYLASNSEPSGDIVRLLLRFGARVIMKTQFRDPDGILNHLQNVTAEENEHIFYLLLEAAEAFDLCMIKRNHTLNATQKETLIERAKTPISLLAQVRLHLRRHFGNSLINVVPKMEIPKTLHHYLFFDYS